MVGGPMWAETTFSHVNTLIDSPTRETLGTLRFTTRQGRQRALQNVKSNVNLSF